MMWYQCLIKNQIGWIEFQFGKVIVLVYVQQEVDIVEETIHWTKYPDSFSILMID